MRKLYKIELDGNKAYLTREFNGEILIMSITYDSREARDYGALYLARAAIRRGIAKRRDKLKLDFTPGYFVANVETNYSISIFENRILNQLKRKKRRVLQENKYPKTKAKHVGVEIEFVSKSDASDINDALISANLEQYTNLTTDGSVRGDSSDNCDGSCRDNCECFSCDSSCDDNCDGDHDRDCSCECTCNGSGHELRVIAPESEIRDIIIRVCKVLKEVDASVNKTCGLHVHLDMRSRDVKQSFHNLVAVQPLLYSIVPRSRATGGFSIPNKDKEFKQLESRYVGINPNSYQKHKTVEVRLHSGTVCAVKINNWIELLLSVVRYEGKINSIKTIKGVSSRLNLSPKLVTYIKERSLKFKNDKTFDQNNLAA